MDWNEEGVYKTESEIRKLMSERDRLRKALEEIVEINEKPSLDDIIVRYGAILRIATEALKG